MSLPSASTSVLSDSEVLVQLENDDFSSDESLQSDSEVLPTRENASDSDNDDDSSASVDNDGGAGGGGDGLHNNWTVYNGPDFISFPYTLLGGYKEPHVNKPVSILDFFHLFFSEEILNEIVAETNRYAEEKINKQRPLRARSIWSSWKNVTFEEIKAFLGVVLNMALNPKPSIQDFFSSEWVFHQPFFVNIFSRDRFFQIFWCFHVSPPNPNMSNRSRGDKVKNIVAYLQTRFAEYFVPLYECSVDESTVAFKGRVSFKCYNPKKPTKWGLKVFVLSDSRSGYVHSFEPYYGSSTTESLVRPDLPFTSRIVLHLANNLVSGGNAGSGFHIFTDRYYTSLELADELKKMKIHLTGTVMPNRKGLPEGIKKGKLKLKKHETKAFRHQNNTLVLAWRDKRDVVMLSNYYNDDMEDISRRSKNNEVQEIQKPSVICNYNRYMGGVDQADHYIASYKFSRKSVKWWRKLFFWLLEVAVVNSFLLFNMNKQNNGERTIQHRKFREILITQLVGDVRNTTSLKRGRPTSLDKEERLNKQPHFLAAHPTKKTKDCAVCSNRKVPGGRRETLYFCKTCSKNPGLHPAECFERYHTMLKYKNF